MCYSREKGAKKDYTDKKLHSIEVREILCPILADPNTTHIFMCGYAKMAEDCKISLRAISSQDLFDPIVEGGWLHCELFGGLLPKTGSFMMRRLTKYPDKMRCLSSLVADAA